MKVNEKKIKSHTRPKGMPFNITKLGHIVLNVADVERSTKFYTEVMGLKVSDVYTDEIAPGGMVFFRFNGDHHGIAVVGSMPGNCRRSSSTISPSRWQPSMRCSSHASI